MHFRIRIALATALLVSAPPFGASADPVPPSPASASPSVDAGSRRSPDPLTAALFAGTSSPPTADAWRHAVPLSGVRRGDLAERNGCTMTHVAEWVRVDCATLNAARVDLLAGEKRDFSILGAETGSFGEAMMAQFSMHPGDRRIIQWTVADLWQEFWPGDNGDMMTGGPQPIGPMYGMAVQVDWASGSEPVISMF